MLSDGARGGVQSAQSPGIALLSRRHWQVPREVLIALGAVVFYFGGRGLTEAAQGPALEHARQVVSFEKALGVYWEPQLQGLIDDSRWLVDAMNWVYIWAHWPVIAVTLVWLVLRHGRIYRRTRNAMVVSGAIGMVVFVLYPLAPPRLAGLDLLDTVTLHSHAYRVLQPPGFTNQYAAMPSLHFGWNLLMGIAIFLAARHWLLRVVGAVLPVLMAAAVVLTANHYLVDVLAGGLLALFGLGVATWWERRTAPAAAVPRQAAAPAAEATAPAAEAAPSAVPGQLPAPVAPAVAAQLPVPAVPVLPVQLAAPVAPACAPERKVQ